MRSTSILETTFTSIEKRQNLLHFWLTTKLFFEVRFGQFILFEGPIRGFWRRIFFRSFHINTQKVNFRFDLGVKKTYMRLTGFHMGVKRVAVIWKQSVQSNCKMLFFSKSFKTRLFGYIGMKRSCYSYKITKNSSISSNLHKFSAGMHLHDIKSKL